jgi:hypothetical protein
MCHSWGEGKKWGVGGLSTCQRTAGGSFYSQIRPGRSSPVRMLELGESFPVRLQESRGSPFLSEYSRAGGVLFCQNTVELVESSPVRIQ